MKDNISGKLIKVKSYINLEDIKKGDILIFDTDETILKDDGIYLLNIKNSDTKKSLFGKYKEKYKFFIVFEKMEKNKILVLNDDKVIKVIGKLVKLLREFEL